MKDEYQDFDSQFNQRNHTGTAHESREDEDQAPEDDLPWLKFEDIDELPEIESEVIIEGFLRIGEKLGITAGTKRFKTWLLLYIAYCIANGIDFLGFKTKQSKVVFFDLELSRNSLKRRLGRIQKAVGSGDFKNLKKSRKKGLLRDKPFKI